MAASLATMSGKEQKVSSLKDMDDYDQDTDDDVEELSSGDEDYARSRKRKKTERNSNKLAESDEESTEEPITADSVLAMMPKTDKQVRHEKRLKAMERKERREKRRARLSGELDSGFEVVEGDDDIDDDLTNKNLEGLSDKEKKKILEARELIKAGLGQTTGEVENKGFEVVPAEKSKEKSSLPVLDQREYNSENEAYDSDDYAETLALGTMMLRKSKAKSLVDASYNRFAWNDPEDLPDWFLDDENKHYRPQLPIPPELLTKMKEKFMSLATRPIAKVAEARARKNKRARVKLAAAKKKAEAVANSSEMSEAMKLKAISKAMRGNDASRPSKTYVVSKKGGGTKGGKGVKLVDKRMKNDKRAMDRATKKRKNGKKGGLTGSKRRRNHS
jgi:AdoMet-dependent rRNA methyltransferase SPB1